MDTMPRKNRGRRARRIHSHRPKIVCGHFGRARTPARLYQFHRTIADGMEARFSQVTRYPDEDI
jgi:hypothetical protein